jgi:LacI family transcriptional regulator
MRPKAGVNAHGCAIVFGSIQSEGGTVTTSDAARRRPTTLSEVAREAGVSIATASKALNGRTDVKPETRERVLDVARLMAFSPNVAARSLTATRSGTVGLITSDLEGRFSIPILMGAEDAFGAGRMSVFLCDARGDNIRERHHIDALLSRRVDGIIVVGSSTNPRPSIGLDLPVPTVYAYAPSQNPEDLSIISDNVQAGRIAVEHLVDIGRNRIGHISGDPNYSAAQDRARGVEQGMSASGLELAGGRTMFGQWNEAWGRGATRMLLERDPDVDAIVCGSDQIARGAIEALAELGRNVPHDIAIIGFDNWGVIATNTRPALSSVDFRLEEVGRIAAQKLFEAIDGGSTAGIIAVEPHLVTRGSTTPLG